MESPASMKVTVVVVGTIALLLAPAWGQQTIPLPNGNPWLASGDKEQVGVGRRASRETITGTILAFWCRDKAVHEWLAWRGDDPSFNIEEAPEIKVNGVRYKGFLVSGRAVLEGYGKVIETHDNALWVLRAGRDAVRVLPRTLEKKPNFKSFLEAESYRISITFKGHELYADFPLAGLEEALHVFDGRCKYEVK